MSAVYKCKDGNNHVIGRGAPAGTIPCADRGGVAESIDGEIKESPSDTPNSVLKKKDERFVMKYKWPIVIISGIGVFLIGKQLKWF